MDHVVIPIGSFYARRHRYSRFIVCGLYVIFSCFFGIWQTNAANQDMWEEFLHLNGSIPFIAYYPKSFIVDPRSEIHPSHVKYCCPENNRIAEYYKWCMVLDSPDESLRVRIVSFATEGCCLGENYYETGRDLILAHVFKACEKIRIEEAGEYVMIQGIATRERGQKELIIVYLGNEDDKRIAKENTDRTYIFQKIIITEKIPEALGKNDKIIQEMLHRFKPCFVISPEKMSYYTIRPACSP